MYVVKHRKYFNLNQSDKIHRKILSYPGVSFNGLIQEKPIKVPDWDEDKEKNCLLDCNGNQGNRKWFKMVGFHIKTSILFEKISE